MFWQAFETSIHPLAQLLDSLVDAFLATYVGIGSHLRLLHHAVDEFKSFVTRLYLIIRLSADCIDRVIACIEKLDMSVNLTAVREL